MQPIAKILIVEDNYLIALELRHALTTAGYEVVGITGNSTAAMTLVSRHRPDLAIVNLGLRDWRDGAETVAQMARQHGLPILVCTGFPDMALERAGIAELVAGVVHKPCSAAELVEAVAKGLGHRCVPPR